MIEWKYTESYGPPINVAGNPTRIKRYAQLAFAPEGPVRSDMGLAPRRLFYEPFYQLLRRADAGFPDAEGQRGRCRSCPRVAHCAGREPCPQKGHFPDPRRFGDDAFIVFRSLLVHPEDFVSRSLEVLFGPLISDFKRANDWAAYLAGRYAFLVDPIENSNRTN